jgi:hypothetical protein
MTEGLVVTADSLPNTGELLEASAQLTPELVADQARQAALLPEEEQEEAFAALRLARKLSDYQADRDETSNTIGEGIILLLENGEEKLASRLITPSVDEDMQLDAALRRRHPGAFLQGDATYETLTRVRNEKREAFNKRFRDHLKSLPDELYEDIMFEVRIGAADPEGALDVPSSFWGNFMQLPYEMQHAVLKNPSRMSVAVETFQQIGHSGLLEHTAQLLPILSAMDGAVRESTLTSLSNIRRELQQLEPPVELGGYDMSVLTRYRNPRQAIMLARELFPNESVGGALSSMDYELDNDHTNLQPGQLFEIPRGIAAALPTLHEALGAIGVSSHQLTSYVRGITRLQRETGWSMAGPLSRTLIQVAEILPSHVLNYEETLSHQTILKTLYRILERPEGVDGEEVVGQLDLYLNRLDAMVKHYQYAKLYMEEEREADQNATEAKEDSPTPADILNDTPELSDTEKKERAKLQYKKMIRNRSLGAYFDELGIPEEMATKMFGAWQSYDEIYNVFKAEGIDRSKDLTDEMIAKAALDTASRLYKNLSAVQEYQETYGTGELLALHNTFGIVHFRRGTGEQFHNQMLRWNGLYRNKRGDLAKHKTMPRPRNVMVAGIHDHNGAFDKAAAKFFGDFGENGSFYFEASTKAELSRAIVKVGDRERQAGRDPLQNPSVRNLIVAGHGSPESLQLDAYDLLDLESYVVAMMGMNKLNDLGGNAVPNDYSRHLGNLYRVILHACSAGRAVPVAMNISQMIHAATGAPVESSPEDSYGYEYTRRTGKVRFRVKNEEGKIVPVNSVRHE